MSLLPKQFLERAKLIPASGGLWSALQNIHILYRKATVKICLTEGFKMLLQSSELFVNLLFFIS